MNYQVELYIRDYCNSFCIIYIIICTHSISMFSCIGCRYISIMEPLSELYCNPYLPVDNDVDTILTGCGVIYPRSGESVAGFRWFANTGSDLSETEKLKPVQVNTLSQENNSHRTLVNLASLSINSQAINPQEIWCRALLSNGTLLQQSQAMRVTSSPTYSILPRCPRSDVLSTDTSKCIDLIPSDSTMSNYSSTSTQRVVSSTDVCQPTTITITVTVDSVRGSNTGNGMHTAASITTTTTLTNTTPVVNELSSTSSDQLVIFLSSSIPLAIMLLILIVMQFICILILCCKRGRSKDKAETKSVSHQPVTNVSSVDSPFYNLKPAYYINPRSISSLPKNTQNSTRPNLSNGTASSFTQGNDGIVEMYDSVDACYYEITDNQSETSNNTYTPLQKATLDNNNIYSYTVGRDDNLHVDECEDYVN